MSTLENICKKHIESNLESCLSKYYDTYYDLTYLTCSEAHITAKRGEGPLCKDCDYRLHRVLGGYCNDLHYVPKNNSGGTE